MQHSPATPAATKARRDQRTSMRIATLLSLVLHAILAGGLATTSLGILPSPTPDNPTGTTIFKPKVAVDFPLEVPKSPSDAGAHEKPLSLAVPTARPTAARPAPAKAAPARTVSPRQVKEPTEASRAKPELPQRSATPDAASPDAAKSLDRTALSAAAEQKARADALNTKGEKAPPATPPRPTAAQRPQRMTTDRATRSRPRQPRESALLSDAKPRPVAPPAPRREATPTPRAATLARQQAAAADLPAEPARADSLEPAVPAASEPAARPPTQPLAASAPRRQTSSVRRSPAVDGAAMAELSAADESAGIAPSTTTGAVAVAERSPRSVPSSAGETISAVAPRALARPGVAMTSADDIGATVDAVSPPAGPSAAELAAAQVIAEDGASAATIRPGSRSRVADRSRGDTARATGGGATAAMDEGDVGADSGPSASPSATAVAGARGDRSTVGAANTPAADAASLGRATIGADQEDGDAAAAATLTDAGLAAGTGREPQDDGSGLMAAAPAAAPAPRPSALASRGAGRAGGPAAVSRGEANDGPIPAGAAIDGDEAEGLSTEGMLEALAAIGPATAGGRRASAAPALAIASLPRATAFVLPVEGRVREIAAPFANRVREKRDERKTDSMVDRGLDFLRRAQQPDGRWSLGSYPGAKDEAAPKLTSDTAATGLALLSFLGAGHDHFEGPHRDTVRRGLEFLLAIQKDDGDLYLPADPLSNSCAWLYSHGIATMSLCEAVGMTGDEIIRPAAERACRFIAASQHPDRGGWRYTPRSDADLSVSGWMLVALRSGQLATVPVDPRTLDGVRSLLDASAMAPSSPAAKSPLARFYYNARKPEQRPAEMSTACMNALGTLMRLHTGWKKTDPQVVANGHALAAIRPTYGSAQQKLRDCYLWYYVSQVLVHTGGAEWDSWYASLDETLSAHQASTGQAAGSWDPLGPSPDRWGQYGGRIYVTAFHLLTLEVPYRHLPTYSFDE